MPNPVRTLELSTPVWSCWEPSSKMLSTLTCWPSGGCVGMPNDVAFDSPGSITAFWSAE